MMTDTQWKPHIASWQTKEEGDVGSSASFDCKVPGFGCIFAHAHGWWEGRGTAKTQKRVQGGVRKKGEGQTSPKEQSQLHLVSLRGTETQERIPVTGLGGPRGRICSRLRTHRGQWQFFSSGDPPALGKEEPRGDWRPSRGPLGGYTDCFLPALQSCPGAGRRECGKQGQKERKDGFVQ